MQQFPTPPRKTPKAEKTYRHLLATALQCFQKDAFDQVTMRDIAKAAHLAVGSAYYYFRSKEEIVMAFYRVIQQEAETTCPGELRRIPSLQGRIQYLLQWHFDRLQAHRLLLKALLRTALDISHPLSPFSAATQPMRHAAIQCYVQALEGTTTSIPSRLRPILPTLLWLYHMGLMLYWINDDSPKQQRTHALRDRSLTLLFSLIALFRIPVGRRIQQALVGLVSDFAGTLLSRNGGRA